MGSDGAADPRRRRHLCGAARLGLQPIRACRARHRRSSSLQYVPLDDPIKISRLTLRNTSGRTRRLSRDRLCRMGARSVARRIRAVRVDRDRSRHRRDVRRNPWNMRRSDRESPSPISRGRQTDWTGDRREFIGRNGTLGEPRRARRRSAAFEHASAPVSIRAARCERRSMLPPGGRVEIVFFLGEAASARRGARARLRGIAPPISTLCCPRSPALGRRPGCGSGEDARSRDGHHAERLAAVSDAGLPHLGALRRSTRRAAPMAFATSCRTAWRWSPRGRR